MSELWRANIRRNHDLVRGSSGPGLVTVVSGTELDRAYWEAHFTAVAPDIFRADAGTAVVSVCEATRKGNFLGTLNAWAQTRAAIAQAGRSLPDIVLMSMVFGQGKRLSPFTQSLGNRKPALPTPLRGGASRQYLCTADLSVLYTNLWLQHLTACGFRGVVVKWGDEAIVPGVAWPIQDYRGMDALRFVWRTAPTPELAREKEWVLFDAAGLMRAQYPRQPLEALNRRLSGHGYDPAAFGVGVNLGSLAISYDLLDLALQVFGEDLAMDGRWADWDPYVWLGLFCRSEAEWQAEAELEAQAGRQGLRDLLARYPDFYARITRWRQAAEAALGRPLAVGVVDFGQPLWTDFGLHTTLRAGLLQATADSERGQVMREFFGLRHERDARGNILIDSTLPANADIRDSVILDTVILDGGSVIHGGLLVAGRFRHVWMPEGGVAIASAADDLRFNGPNAVALRAVGPAIHLPAGGRYTTLFLPTGPEAMTGNESIVDYEGDNFNRPILGNSRSFADAARLMAALDGRELERRWLHAWAGWLDR